MFDAAAAKAGKRYFLIPYFIAAHPGCRDDMMNIALWLKRNGYRDQVQTFTPTPMPLATAMYYSGGTRWLFEFGRRSCFDSQDNETASVAQGLSPLSHPVNWPRFATR